MTRALKPEILLIGLVQKPHGVCGALKVMPLTDNPQRYLELKRIFLGDEDQKGQPFTVEKVQFQSSRIILTLKGIPDRTVAEQWRNKYVQIPLEEAEKLPEGSFYYYQLIGLAVKTVTGKEVGTVKDVQSFPAHDVFVVDDSDREILIPDVPDFIEKIDLESKELIINPIDGLLD